MKRRLGLRSLTTGRFYDEIINKTVLLKQKMNSTADNIIIKATNKREEVWTDSETLNK